MAVAPEAAESVVIARACEPSTYKANRSKSRSSRHQTYRLSNTNGIQPSLPSAPQSFIRPERDRAR